MGDVLRVGTGGGAAHPAALVARLFRRIAVGAGADVFEREPALAGYDADAAFGGRLVDPGEIEVFSGGLPAQLSQDLRLDHERSSTPPAGQCCAGILASAKMDINLTSDSGFAAPCSPLDSGSVSRFPTRFAYTSACPPGRPAAHPLRGRPR